MRAIHMLLAALAALAILVAAALLLAPSRDVTATIHIDAPPDRVWAVLIDTAAYPQWNRAMTLTGALTAGNTIEHTEGEGADRMVFHPIIVTATPPRELSWYGEIGAGRILGALHRFRLAPDVSGTRLTQTEHLRGVLLWLWDAGRLAPRFQAMNAALKARVEQR